MTIKFSRAGRGRWPLPTALAAVAVLSLTACDLDELLEIEDPDVVTTPVLQDSAAIDLRIRGALGDFQFAFSGGDLTGGFAPYVGLFTDELYNPDTFTTRLEIDRRFIDRGSNTQILVPYRFAHRARRQAIEAQNLITEFASQDSDDWAWMRGLEGYSYILLGENYCSGVPFSDVQDGELVDGPPLTTRATFEEAARIFQSAIDVASPGSDFEYLARIGLGRAHLNLGNYDLAAQAVASVPTDWAYYVEHSINTPGQRNAMFSLQENGRLSVASNEGTTSDQTIFFRQLLDDDPDLSADATVDPRLPVILDGVGFDGITPLYVQQIWDDPADDVAVAMGVEARLIEAEAALNAGAAGRATFFQIHNALRSDAGLVSMVSGGQSSATLPALTDTGQSMQELALLHFTEKAFWTYGRAHRLGDVRRMIRQYGFDPNEVLPSGAYHKQSTTYGTQTAWPIPFEEDNNPLFRQAATDGCIADTGF